MLRTMNVAKCMLCGAETVFGPYDGSTCPKCKRNADRVNRLKEEADHLLSLADNAHRRHNMACMMLVAARQKDRKTYPVINAAGEVEFKTPEQAQAWLDQLDK